MKLSRLYTNRPAVFSAVDFTSGLNVVFAEIRLPQNRKKDTHNLGKTTLGRLVDFCLLSGRDSKFFLFKHQQLFDGFVFLLELELLDGSYVTVRRGVNEPTKLSFKRHQARMQDFRDLQASRGITSTCPSIARSLLDGVLDLRALKPWDYRKGLGYLLRSQDDYREVFQLRKWPQARRVEALPRARARIRLGAGRGSTRRKTELSEQAGDGQASSSGTGGLCRRRQQDRGHAAAEAEGSGEEAGAPRRLRLSHG